jgi:hypothetical protein
LETIWYKLSDPLPPLWELGIDQGGTFDFADVMAEEIVHDV